MPDKYETRITRRTVNKVGEPLYSERATDIEIVDEAGGEFVEVSQDKGSGLGKIQIDPDEWPNLREAIDTMIAQCRASGEPGA